ncbi:fumarate hydratase [Candidatus Bathyarchaeota archaeon]|nr:MAG: fumarate hydratase [Candidatus Bathyarchaeota archaeon]RJS81640.1 MAG: fumarate hydratase [Candidatus Bathyarchaeota archaeon]RLI17833.1 MAG: fumarate hydratase [Candidatus Bathyarchaeota archaeon]HDD70394.1 fumarate hydratase [Candidatus Bathyarchaeota archaeon]
MEKIVENVAFNLLKQAVIYLPEDVKQALKKAYEEETSETGKTQLKAILDNIELAEKYQAPICQDTGTIIFYIKAGSEVKGLEKIENALINATKRATKEVPLRPNAVNPFTQKNSGDNTGRFIPFLNWEIVPGNSLELTVMPKGGGSENVCVTGMLVPGEGINGLKKFVVETVIKAGAKPCPPNILGIAMGGGTDIAIKLAKKALLRPLTEPNPDPEIAKLEKEILEAVNMTGIGPMGLGGKTTVLGVNIEYAYRHPASFPAAVAFNCWAARRASARINADGTVEYLTHKKGV